MAPGFAERCKTCHRKLTRSHPQNALMWVLLHKIADQIKPEGVAFSPDSWHKYFKSRFLGCDDTKLPNGKVMTEPKSTATLDVAEFSDYFTQIEAWASEHGVYLDSLAA